MKIAFFIDSMNGFGGAQRVISVLSNAFTGGGNEVMLLMTGDTAESVYPLEDATRYAYTGPCNGVANKLKKYITLRKKVLEFKPDVAVAFLTATNVVAALILRFTGIPLIISERNDPDKCTPNEKRLSKLFYPFADGLVVQTENIKQQLSRIYKKEIKIIPNPLQQFNFEKNDYALSKKMVAVGRINVQKNYPLMLEAFKQLLQEYPGYQLHIYGAGDRLDEYQSLAQELAIQDNVTFMGNRPNPLERELDADMYVMSSDFEGMPNALAEAMSVGFPSISTDCDGGGARYLIRDGQNGILVEKGNREQLAQAMKVLAQDRAYAKRLGEEAKSLKQMLHIDKITQLWVDYINQFVK